MLLPAAWKGGDSLQNCQPNHTTHAPAFHADASLPTIFADANAMPVSPGLLQTCNSSETPTNALIPAQFCAHAAPNARLLRACPAPPPAVTCAFVSSGLPTAYLPRLLYEPHVSTISPHSGRPGPIRCVLTGPLLVRGLRRVSSRAGWRRPERSTPPHTTAPRTRTC